VIVGSARGGKGKRGEKKGGKKQLEPKGYFRMSPLYKNTPRKKTEKSLGELFGRTEAGQEC